jgi:hypothetical protein
MSERVIAIPDVTEGFDERWAAWQRRGDEHDRATKRNLFLLVVALIISGAVLSGLGWL